MDEFTPRIAELHAPDRQHPPLTFEDFRAYFGHFEYRDWNDEKGWAILAHHVFSGYEYRDETTLALNLTPGAERFYVPAHVPRGGRG